MAFSWVPYYKELAQKLIQYRDKRKELLDIIRGIDREYIDFLQKDNDGTKITDIQPFAIYSIFNRLTIIKKKQHILEYLKQAFGLESEVPNDFDGIPSVNPENSFWGMPWENEATKEVNENWDLFEIANQDNFNENEFCKCFDKVLKQPGAKWNITHALFRMNPDRFISLDGNSTLYLDHLNTPVFKEMDLNGKNYLEFKNKVEQEIKKHNFIEKNFYELSHNAYDYGKKNKNYWLIAPGEYPGAWEKAVQTGTISIGWGWIGDLNNYNDKKQFVRDFNNMFKDQNNPKKSKTRSAYDVWKFGKEIKENDIIFAKDGSSRIFGVGTVTTDYYYDDSLDEEYAHFHNVNWEYLKNFEYSHNIQKTITELNRAEGDRIMEAMNKALNANIIELKELLETNKNIILHGAPGTGKTYTAKEIAAQVLFNKTYSDVEQDSELNKQFNSHTEFVQFHPSYDYSDFVEGLRPVEGDTNGEVGFERKDGVFMDFCKKALKKSSNVEESNFDECWDSLIDHVRENLAKEKLTKIGSWEFGLSSKESLKYSSVNSPSQYNFTITKQNVYNAYQGKKARPKGGFQKDMNQIVEFMKENFKLIPYDKIAKNEIDNKPYIFIIDEINRGEMSKIFGELFFSIDPDYRGTKGKVRTQYANMLKEPNDFDDFLNVNSRYGNFFVPENVYIIGTMNDIDRSVESMDFAMRRRFTFVELKADECLGMLSDIDCSDEKITVDEIKTKMKVLNSKIEREPGLSSAYHIGGSYFSKLKKYENKNKNEAFKALWNNHLKPLITDYLRGIPNLNKKLENYEADYLNARINNSEGTNDKN
ncbi:AAA family ATPase [Treponema berlinense]|uniref:AAA family ATPase n=1 Tax=Treponema berlinense TaxID=225004 RepID=UPI0023F6784B|nr:AAA family ATPase [Treponema berlinense]